MSQALSQSSKKIYEEIKAGFEKIVNEHKLDCHEISISSQGLSPEEAIGNTKRKDYPILTGKEVMLQAEYRGFHGQSFTDSPATFSGSLAEVLAMDMVNDPHARGIYFAAMNAVMKSLGLIEHTIHCKTEEPVECAKHCLAEFKAKHQGKKIVLVGYQPSLFEALAADFELRVLDLNPANVGKNCFGVVVEHGINDYQAAIDWADLVFCTGSVFCNGTMDLYLDIKKPVIFFGITASGAAHILGLERFCPLAK
jgi:uncharacterized protein (DUF4213/DUF364 family)